MMHNNIKLIFIVSILLYFTPVLSFLSKVNLTQILTLDIYIIILSQTLLCIVTIFLSFISHKLFFKKHFSFTVFLFFNSLLIYLLFFFNNLKSFIYNKPNFYFDELIILFIYIILYFLLINLKKKKLDFLVRFSFIFIFLQLINF